MYFTYLKLGQNGRLGNQLFQVASTIGIAQRNGCFFKFLDSWPVRDLLKNELPLMRFNTLKEYIEVNSGQFVNLKEGKNGYKPINLQAQHILFSRWKNLDGYFQSEKYFDYVDYQIRYYFEPKDEILNYLKGKYQSILEEGDFTSLHVRRGDYLTLEAEHPWKPHPPITMEYIENAIEEIGAKKLCVFSDDINWCKENLKKYDAFFVEERSHDSYEERHNESPDFMKIAHKNLVEDFTEMMLMSMCKDHIISNSSFSWWGAWLNKNKNKKVIAPRKWFSEEHAQNVCMDPENYIYDIIPKDWKIL